MRQDHRQRQPVQVPATTRRHTVRHARRLGSREATHVNVFRKIVNEATWRQYTLIQGFGWMIIGDVAGHNHPFWVFILYAAGIIFAATIVSDLLRVVARLPATPRKPPERLLPQEVHTRRRRHRPPATHDRTATAANRPRTPHPARRYTTQRTPRTTRQNVRRHATSATPRRARTVPASFTCIMCLRPHARTA